MMTFRFPLLLLFFLSCNCCSCVVFPRVLLLGDSLTSGCCSGVPHPYLLTLQRSINSGLWNVSLSTAVQTLHLHSETLQSKLKQNFVELQTLEKQWREEKLARGKGQEEAVFVLNATPGECVLEPCILQSMQSRWKSLVENSSVHGVPFDYVVLLGGTNDIFHDFPPASIASSLWSIHSSAHSLGIRTISLLIPPFGGGDDGWRPAHRRSHGKDLAEARGMINTELLQKCALWSKKMKCINLEEWLPQKGMVEEDRNVLWAENVHPNPIGYDVWGQVVAVQLLKLFIEDGN